MAGTQVSFITYKITDMDYFDLSCNSSICNHDSSGGQGNIILLKKYNHHD